MKMIGQILLIRIINEKIGYFDIVHCQFLEVTACKNVELIKFILSKIAYKILNTGKN